MMITDSDSYFTDGCGRCARFRTAACSTRIWAEGLAALRALCCGAELDETAKWGHPCYMHAGRNVAIIGAFRTDFRLSFFEPGLMKDPAGVLEKQGPNARFKGTLRFSDVGQVADKADVIRAYLEEAKQYAAAGLRAPKDDRTLDLPVELVDALDADPELAVAFHALTPGRQKSYVINLNGAKQAATRVARIAKFRSKIIAGKGALDR